MLGMIENKGQHSLSCQVYWFRGRESAGLFQAVSEGVKLWRV